MARELKQGQQRRKDEHLRQADRQAQNDIWRQQIKELPGRGMALLFSAEMEIYHNLLFSP